MLASQSPPAPCRFEVAVSEVLAGGGGGEGGGSGGIVYVGRHGKGGGVSPLIILT